MNNSIIGIVMCGGKSSRMGQDKGLLKRGNITWVQHLTSLLETLVENVLISINPQQKKAYSSIFPNDKLIKDYIDIQGPLGGILGIHRLFPLAGLLVLACDMQFMKAHVLKKLLAERKNKHGCIYSNNNRLEPLAALYRPKGLEEINSRLLTIEKPKKKDVSIYQWIKTGSFHIIEANKDEKIYFDNLNTIKELKTVHPLI